ncbi:MAG: DUF47 family protein [Candidatus Cloacimonetes bacterium]|nr:DUF47 family protein [Candidatus Cloacimonadota bacterium]
MHFSLKRTRQLEHWLDDFTNTLTDAALIFEKAVDDYLQSHMDDFERRCNDVSAIEKRADSLRRDVETELYAQTLIPESRGDVLSILENSDNVVDCIKETLMQFSVEQPDIPEEFDLDFKALAHASRDAVDELAKAIHSFFKGESFINNQIHKVYFYEKEADAISEKLKRAIFASPSELALKLQLNRFVQLVEDVSNFSESVADRLAIYAIKRQI